MLQLMLTQLLGAVPLKDRPTGQVLHLEAVPSKQVKHVASQLPHVFVEWIMNWLGAQLLMIQELFGSNGV
jgi:hypothetical protein